MRFDKNYVDYKSEARAMRARYIGSLLKSGWNAVFSVFRSAIQLLRRTVITASQETGSCDDSRSQNRLRTRAHARTMSALS